MQFPLTPGGLLPQFHCEGRISPLFVVVEGSGPALAPPPDQPPPLLPGSPEALAELAAAREKARASRDARRAQREAARRKHA